MINSDIDRQTAELIASKINSRLKPSALFKSPWGFCLKSPSKVRMHDREQPDYVGTYFKTVTTEDILQDWDESDEENK